MPGPRTPPVINPQAYSPTVWQDGVTPVNAVNMNKLEQGLAAAVGIPADVVVTPATALLIRNRFGAGDTQPAFRLNAGGRMEWGVGGATAPDVTLSRTGTAFSKGYMSLEGGLWVATLLEVGSNLNAWHPDGTSDTFPRSQIRNAAGQPPGVWFGPGNTGLDAGLYRTGVEQLTTQYLTAKALYSTVASPTAIAYGSWATSDPNYRFTIGIDGPMKWGDGTAALDTNLYRASASTLATDGLIRANGGVTVLNGPFTSQANGAGSVGLQVVNMPVDHSGYLAISKYNGDASWRLLITANGHIQWGDGTTGLDCHLHRSGVGELSMPSTGLVVGGSIWSSKDVVVNNGNLGGKLYFGSPADVTLYRIQAEVIGTDGSFYLRGAGSFISFTRPGEQSRFYIGPDGAHNWGTGAASTDTNLFRNGSVQLQTDNTFIIGGYLDIRCHGGADTVGMYMASLPAAGGWAMITKRAGAADWAYYLDPDGRMYWSAGTGPQDTSLWRNAPNWLGTSGAFSSDAGHATQRITLGGGKVYLNTANDTWLERLSAGVVGVNGVAIGGGSGGVIDRQMGQADITNTAAETSLYSKVIAAGAMGVDKMLRLTLGGWFQAIPNGSTANIRIKFGGVTWIQDGISASTGSGNQQPWKLVLLVVNGGSASSQYIHGVFDSVDPPDAAPAAGFGRAEFNLNQRGGTWSSVGRATINTAVAQTLEVTVQWDDANTGKHFFREMAILELV